MLWVFRKISHATTMSQNQLFVKSKGSFVQSPIIVAWFFYFYRLDIVAHAIIVRVYELEIKLGFRFNLSIKAAKPEYRISRTTVVLALILTGLLSVLGSEVIADSLTWSPEVNIPSELRGAYFISLLVLFLIFFIWYVYSGYTLIDGIFKRGRRKLERRIEYVRRAGLY
jgi:hypothetical protein